MNGFYGKKKKNKIKMRKEKRKSFVSNLKPSNGTNSKCTSYENKSNIDVNMRKWEREGNETPRSNIV